MLSSEVQTRPLAASKQRGWAPSWRRLLLGSLAFYLLAMMLMTPLNVMSGLFSKVIDRPLPQMQGTLWAGHSRDAQALGGLRSLSWRFDPRSLLEGAWGYRLTLGQGVVQGGVRVHADSRLSLRDLRVQGRLSALLAHLGAMPLLLDAGLTGRMQSLLWSPEQGCTQAREGRFLIDDFSGPLGRRLNALEGLSLQLSCRGERLSLRLEAGASAAGLEGELLLAADGQYRIRVVAEPRSPQLESLFSDLGMHGQGGRLRWIRQGKL